MWPQRTTSVVMVALRHELQSEREEGIRTREWARGSGVMRGVVEMHRASGGKQELAQLGCLLSTQLPRLLAEG